MRIAIPLFNGRVSPRFDASPEVWIVELKGGKVNREERYPVETLNLHQRLDQLASKSVDKLICGGIDRFSYDQLGHRGIEVIYNVAGEAKEVLNSFIKGGLRPGFFCERRRGRGFCRGRKKPYWRRI